MPVDWAPTVANVGALLRARTKDTNGNELGTFTADTRPTGTQVEDLINTAADDVASTLPDQLDPKYWERAAAVSTLGAALKVELSYFPEQVATGRSPYTQLKEMYNDELKRLVNAVQGGDSAVDGGAGGAGSAMPVGLFPVPTDPLGWQTSW